MNSPALKAVDTRGYLTLAFGASHYIQMAKALARSIRIHGARLPIAIVTDETSRKDQTVAELFDHVIPIDAARGRSVEQKLALDLYSPFKETVFIDSDCLAFANVDDLWSAFRSDLGFSPLPRYKVHSGDEHKWIADTRYAFDALGICWIYEFNSGAFYFDRSDAATRVFSTAREIFRDHKAYKLRGFKGASIQDEPVLGLSMAVNGLTNFELTDGSVMNTALGTTTGLWYLNAVRGQSDFNKNGQPVSPAIIHFNMETQHYLCYLREMVRLESHFADRAILPPATLVASFRYLFHQFPLILKRAIRLLRHMVKSVITTCGLKK